MLQVTRLVQRQLPIVCFFSTTPLSALIIAVEKKDIATINAISKQSPRLIIEQTNNDTISYATGNAALLH